MDYNDELDPSLNTVAALQAGQQLPQLQMPQQSALQNYPQQDIQQAQNFQNYQANPTRFAQPQFISDQQRQSVLSIVDILQKPQQAQARLAANPLPEHGQQPQLSALAVQEATRQGMTPIAYLLKQRLGNNAITTLPNGQQRSWVDPKLGATDPTVLLKHPQFQNVMQQDPQKAMQIFQALTGQDLEQTLKTNVAQQKQRLEDAHKFISQGHAMGRFSFDPETKAVKSRKMVYNPRTDKVELSQDFTDLDPVEQQHFQVAGHTMMPQIAQQQDTSRNELLQRKHAAQIAALQPNRQAQLPQDSSYAATALPSWADTAMQGTAGTLLGIGNIIRGQADVAGDTGFAPTQGGMNPVRQRAALQNNPTFQKLLKENPRRAMAIAAALQTKQ